MQYLSVITNNVISVLGQQFSTALLLAILMMYVWLLFMEHGIKVTLKLWIRTFKKSRNFRRVFFSFFMDLWYYCEQS